MKIIFMGTPIFAVPTLEAIHEAGHSVELVVTQVDRRRGRGKKLHYTPVKEKALELGMEVYQPENVNLEESIEKMKKLEPDFIVVSAYGQILREEILNMPKYDIINVHASLLPKYRGASPINWSIVNGEKETGVTIMEVAEGLDEGDMIIQRAIPIGYDDNASTIHDKLAVLGGELIVEAIDGLVKGELEKVEQDHELHTYAPKLSREDGKIDWSMKAVDIRNQVRGFKPWPSAFTDYDGERMTVHWLEIIEEDYDGEYGEIVDIIDEGICVKTGDKTVVITELQFPGNRSMKTSDYLLGNEIEKGIVLK